MSSFYGVFQNEVFVVRALRNWWDSQLCSLELSSPESLLSCRGRNCSDRQSCTNGGQPLGVPATLLRCLQGPLGQRWAGLGGEVLLRRFCRGGHPLSGLAQVRACAESSTMCQCLNVLSKCFPFPPCFALIGTFKTSNFFGSDCQGKSQTRSMTWPETLRALLISFSSMIKRRSSIPVLCAIGRW